MSLARLARQASESSLSVDALIAAVSQNDYRVGDVDIAFVNGKRSLSIPVGLSAVGRNGVLGE